MTELNGILYIATGHEGYVDASLGQGHQGLLVIAVDQQTMTGEIIDNDLWHSFAQYVKVRDNQLYLLEQSEGSRCTTLSGMIRQQSSGNGSRCISTEETVPLPGRFPVMPA